MKRKIKVTRAMIFPFRTGGRLRIFTIDLFRWKERPKDELFSYNLHILILNFGFTFSLSTPAKKKNSWDK